MLTCSRKYDILVVQTCLATPFFRFLKTGLTIVQSIQLTGSGWFSPGLVGVSEAELAAKVSS